MFVFKERIAYLVLAIIPSVLLIVLVTLIGDQMFSSNKTPSLQSDGLKTATERLEKSVQSLDVHQAYLLGRIESLQQQVDELKGK